MKDRVFFKFKKLFSDRSDVSIPDLIYTFLIVLFCFVVIFYGADHIAHKSKTRHNLYFSWELQIPFIISAFIPYFGIFLLPGLIPFTIKQRNILYLLTFRLVLAILLAGIAFTLIPCDIGYLQPSIAPKFIYLIKIIAGSHNLIPSLHVSLTIIICNSILPYVNRIIQYILWIILIILPLSTLLTHQHHVLDVISGILFGTIIILSTKFDG